MAIVQAGQRDKLGGFKKRKEEKKGRQGASVWSWLLRNKASDRKGKETVGSSSSWLCEGETADGLGANGSGMGMGLVWGLAWSLGIGNWQSGAELGGSLDWNSRGSSPKRDRPDRERLIQAASGGVRRSGDLCELG